VRPSSGAETLENDAACEMSDTLERAESAAAEDGRAPVNTYQRGSLLYVEPAPDQVGCAIKRTVPYHSPAVIFEAEPDAPRWHERKSSNPRMAQEAG